MKIFLKILDGRIEDVKFKTFGCAAAIASSSMATELIKGKTLTEAWELTNEAVAEALEGLPPGKLECSVRIMRPLEWRLLSTGAARAGFSIQSETIHAQNESDRRVPIPNPLAEPGRS